MDDPPVCVPPTLEKKRSIKQKAVHVAHAGVASSIGGLYITEFVMHSPFVPLAIGGAYLVYACLVLLE